MIIVYSIVYVIVSTLLSYQYFSHNNDGPVELFFLFVLALFALGFGIVTQPFVTISFGGYLFLVVASILLGGLIDFIKS